jgi:dihydroneopterin aldolase
MITEVNNLNYIVTYLFLIESVEAELTKNSTTSIERHAWKLSRKGNKYYMTSKLRYEHITNCKIIIGTVYVKYDLS